MKKKIAKYRRTIGPVFLLLLILCWVSAIPVAAKTVQTVKYSSSQKQYYLYQDKQRVTREGLYSLSDLKTNGRSFQGIYYVTSDGMIQRSSRVRHLAQQKLGGRTYLSGYYFFGKGGALPSSKGVAYLRNQTAGSRNYNGYYYYNSMGKINGTEMGLVYLNCKASNGKLFKGYYYRNALSILNVKDTIRNITLNQGYNKKFQGYRYFDKDGRMVTTPGTHKLNVTYNDVSYKGYYCFAGDQGKMIRKKGLVTLGETYYYVTDSYGKCLTSASKKVGGFSYKFQKDGTGVRTSTKLGSLKSKLTSTLKGYGGTWSVYVKRLDNNDSITINDTPLYAASVIKPFVMASTYNQIHKGTIKETSTITSLNRSMITVSSNDAFNELVKRQTNSYSFSTGRSIVNDYLERCGYTKTEVHHTLHPASGGRISDGGSNKTSVKDCGKLLESIYRGTCVDKASSKKMLNFLLAQQRRWKIPAGLPSGTKVANKTGETSTSDHDIAIVYGPKCTYILCVMSSNASYSSSRISQISRMVYNYFN